MSKYENSVNIFPFLLQYDNLSGMIPDRLSYYSVESWKTFS